MLDIQSNIHAVSNRIHAAALACGRKPNDIQLLAVSKTFSADQVRLAYEAGLQIFGENYVDEALNKIHALDDLAIEWHFIGPLQSNKTRKVAENFSWVHSVANEKVARRLSEQRPDDRQPLNICIQINISNEPGKSGIAPQLALALAKFIFPLPRLKLRGIMGIPKKTADQHQQRQSFHALAKTFEQITMAGIEMDTLSMGMTADMDAAIAEGATIVRIGTAIFGTRDYSQQASKL